MPRGKGNIGRRPRGGDAHRAVPTAEGVVDCGAIERHEITARSAVTDLDEGVARPAQGGNAASACGRTYRDVDVAAT